jgi:hypothetical protein
MDDPDVQVLTARIQQLELQLRSIATTYLGDSPSRLLRTT